MGELELPHALKPGAVYKMDWLARHENIDNSALKFDLTALKRRDMLFSPQGNAAQVVDINEVSLEYMMRIYIGEFSGYTRIQRLEELSKWGQYFRIVFKQNAVQTHVAFLNVKDQPHKHLRNDELELAALNHALITDQRSMVPIMFRRFATIKMGGGHAPFGVSYSDERVKDEFPMPGHMIQVREKDEFYGILPIRYYFDVFGGLYVLARVEEYQRAGHSSHNYLLYPLLLNDESDKAVRIRYARIVNAFAYPSQFSKHQANDIRARISTFENKFPGRSCIWGIAGNISFDSTYDETLVLFEGLRQELHEYVPTEASAD